jgi:predicted nucleic acid-binding Zn ribbon protein
MSDDADRAEERIEAAISDAIAHVRHKMKQASISPCNACHFCGEWVKAGVLFCDTFCREDYEAQEAARKRNNGNR